MFFIGVVGNVFVCVVILRKRNLKIVGNCLIFNFVIVDLGVLFINYLIYISKEFFILWLFGEFVCEIVFFFIVIFYGVGVGCIIVIVFYCYRMLVYCMKL